MTDTKTSQLSSNEMLRFEWENDGDIVYVSYNDDRLYAAHYSGDGKHFGKVRIDPSEAEHWETLENIDCEVQPFDKETFNGERDEW